MGYLSSEGIAWEAGASGGVRRAPKNPEDLVLLSKPSRTMEGLANTHTYTCDYALESGSN